MKITRKHVKYTAGAVTAFGAGMVANTIVNNLAPTPEDAGRIKKALLWVGGHAIGWAIADAAVKSVEQLFDDTAVVVDVTIEKTEDPKSE